MDHNGMMMVANSTNRRRRQRHGSVLALTPAVLAVLCVMTVFTVDVGYLYIAEAELATAAEAAALAGALKLRDDEVGWVVRDSSIEFAELNEPNSGDILVNDDITLGVWDFDTRSFEATVIDPNAVSVTVRRDGQNTAAVPVFFAGIFGLREVNVSGSAIAAFEVTIDEDGNEERSVPAVVQ